MSLSSWVPVVTGVGPPTSRQRKAALQHFAALQSIYYSVRRLRLDRCFCLERPTPNTGSFDDLVGTDAFQTLQKSECPGVNSLGFPFLLSCCFPVCLRPLLPPSPGTKYWECFSTQASTDLNLLGN